LEKIMQRLKLSLIAITFLLLSPSIQAGEIADLFDIASERGRAEGVVTGRFERNIRDYTQAVGDIHALVVDAGREAGCRVFDVRLKMSVKTQQGGVTPYEQPIRVPVCENGLPPPGFLPPDMYKRLMQNYEETKGVAD
jgi:hypothetical protein